VTRRRRGFAIGCALLVHGWCSAAARCQPPKAEVLPQAVQPAPIDAAPVPGGRPGALLPMKPIGAITANTAPTEGELPEDIAAKHFAEVGIIDHRDVRCFNENVYFWQASNLYHRPLYFEQAYVERYGYNYGCLQPLVSGAEFGADFALMPVHWATHIGRRHVYVLGPERPGTRGSACPPY
jgi:hypothetical protein